MDVLLFSTRPGRLLSLSGSIYGLFMVDPGVFINRGCVSSHGNILAVTCNKAAVGMMKRVRISDCIYVYLLFLGDVCMLNLAGVLLS